MRPTLYNLAQLLSAKSPSLLSLSTSNVENGSPLWLKKKSGVSQLDGYLLGWRYKCTSTCIQLRATIRRMAFAFKYITTFKKLILALNSQYNPHNKYYDYNWLMELYHFEIGEKFSSLNLLKHTFDIRIRGIWVVVWWTGTRNPGHPNTRRQHVYCSTLHPVSTQMGRK